MTEVRDAVARGVAGAVCARLSHAGEAMEASGGGWREASADGFVEGEAHGATLADKGVVVATPAGFHPPAACSVIERGLRGVAALATSEVNETEFLLGVSKGMEVANGGGCASIDRAPSSRGVGSGDGCADLNFCDVVRAAGASAWLAYVWHVSFIKVCGGGGLQLIA